MRKVRKLAIKKQKLLSPNGNLYAKRVNFISKMATSMLKVASDIYKMPLYRNVHSPESSSDEWAFFFLYIKYTFVVTQIATKSWIKNHHFLFVPE